MSQGQLQSKTREGEGGANHRNMQSAKYSKLKEHEMHDYVLGDVCLNVGTMTRDGHYSRRGARLNHGFALLRRLRKLKGNRRASLLVGSGINDHPFLSTSPHRLL